MTYCSKGLVIVRFHHHEQFLQSLARLSRYAERLREVNHLSTHVASLRGVVRSLESHP